MLRAAPGWLWLGVACTWACLLLSAGCGSGLHLPSAVLSVMPAQQQRIGSVTNFGDSITCGVGATPQDGTGYVVSNEGYAGLLDAAIDRPAKNFCISGQQGADMTRLSVYPNAVPVLGAAQLYTVMIGVNDANLCGLASGCLANWSQSLSASLAWLCLPASDKALAVNSKSLTGVWTNDLSIGMSTTSAGASLSLPVQQVVAGRSLFVAYRVFDPAVTNAGAATLYVDGVAVGVLHAAIATGHAILTQNGVADTIFVAQVPLGAVGSHTVTVKTISADGAFFSVLWAGASTGQYAQVAGAPRVILGEVTWTEHGYINATVVQYNNLLHRIVSAFESEGMNIETAPTATAILYGFDYFDSLHPNNDGHLRLAVAFASVL